MDKLDVKIRWMLRCDMEDVLKIEQDSFRWPWDEYDFIAALKKKNCIGMVAEHDEQVVGFMVYDIEKHLLHLVNFAVARKFLRRGVGTALVDRLKGKRRHLLLAVSESNLAAQLFFRQCGLKAIKIVPDYFRENDDDAYLFEYENPRFCEVR